jgi:16S rRNA (cytosine1402-N4)-methyltransferase
MDIAHTPVLPEEVLTWLAPRKSGALLVDGTLGEGGHSALFLERFPDLSIIGLDADAAILEIAKKRLAGYGDRIQIKRCWSFEYFEEMSRLRSAPDCPGGAEEPEKSWSAPDIILLDLGISMFHYEKSGRGFGVRRNEPLDMRIDTSQGLSAADLVARLSEEELANLLYNNAEERYSRRIARAVVEARKREPLLSTGQLAEVIWRAMPPGARYGKIHPATRTFQALRIAVNGELERLDRLLDAAFTALAYGGRLGVIAFHSLEDRVVKKAFRARRDAGEAHVLTPKPIAPSEAETRANSASRSAKLRVVEKAG